MDIRTCMPGAVNGSCGFVYLSACSARTDIVVSRTAAVAIADTKSFRVVVVMMPFSFSTTSVFVLPALRFKEGVGRARAFFHDFRKFWAGLGCDRKARKSLAR